MELSQRPRGGYFALTAAERRKNGNIYVNGAILAEKILVIYLMRLSHVYSRTVITTCFSTRSAMRREYTTGELTSYHRAVSSKNIQRTSSFT